MAEGKAHWLVDTTHLNYLLKRFINYVPLTIKYTLSHTLVEGFLQHLHSDLKRLRDR